VRRCSLARAGGGDRVHDGRSGPGGQVRAGASGAGPAWSARRWCAGRVTHRRRGAWPLRGVGYRAGREWEPGGAGRSAVEATSERGMPVHGRCAPCGGEVPLREGRGGGASDRAVAHTAGSGSPSLSLTPALAAPGAGPAVSHMGKGYGERVGDGGGGSRRSFPLTLAARRAESWWRAERAGQGVTGRAVAVALAARVRACRVASG
jgi:hypothetical protein